MKKFVAFMFVAAMSLGLAGCGGGTPPAAEPKKEEAPKADAPKEAPKADAPKTEEKPK